MAIAVEVPKLGNTVEECLIARWARHKGDAVCEGELLAEIETDKATFEVTAPVGGTVLETFFEEGSLVPVFTNLLVIGEPGESAEPFRPGAAKKAVEEKPAMAEAKAPSGQPAAEPVNGGARVSPRARRFAARHGIEISGVRGSGPGARVLERDLRGMLEKREAAPLRASTIRERIARRMRESLAGTAQYTMHAWADAGGLLRTRARVKNSPQLPDVNLNDLVCFCAVEALLELPEVNAEFVEGRIQIHPEVHLGFACDTPRGLLVPVVRSAQELGIDQLAERMKTLAAQAVAGTIAPDDLTGATFTVSNLGAFGVTSFTPLLNPPQVAILGVGAVEVRPVRRRGAVDFIDAIALSLTCDHQVIDGAPGARFLRAVRERIESIEALCPI
jgi:pyruvate dehydrogenase E2 component (dihydrolipoamide acetyltransferase)